MKKKKILWIIIALSSVLIIALAAAVFLLTAGSKESKYYSQMEDAKVYLEEMDYENMIKAYENAIELMPEDPDAYLALAEYYLEQGEYYEAITIANRGYEQTKSRRLGNMLNQIELARLNQEDNEIEISISSETVEKDDSVKLLIKNNVIGNLEEYCYQQYVNEYGDGSSTYISSEEGYRVEFKGLGAELYFENIDKITNRPLPNAKPYKIVILSPQLLFVGYEGYISNSRMGELFNIFPESVLVQKDNSYYLVFEYLDCKMCIETDENGNVVKDKPVIELYPLNPISDWEPEKESVKEDDGKVVGNNTFILGGRSYSYNISELIIYNETLEDLSPLANCPNLEYIVFYNCKIEDLSPLSDCSSLVELNLEESYGNLDISCLKDLSNLRYLGFHECKDIDDISCIYGLSLDILHPCGSSVSKEQCLEYQERHPYCEVWFDYFYPIK